MKNIDALSLEKKFKKYYDVYEKHSMKKQAGFSLDESDFTALGMQLDAFSNWKKFKESNGSVDDLGIVPKIGLDVIAASQATSVVPLIAGVQPIEERQGLIWFKNIVASKGRGDVANNQKLLDARSGRVTLADEFAGEMITDEVVGTGDGSVTDFDAVAKYAPLRHRYTKITVSDQPNTVLVDDGEGHLIGVGGKGTVNYSTGELSISLDTAPADGAKVYATYGTNFEQETEIQTINTDYDSIQVTARTYALRTEIGLFKSFEMGKRFNVDVDEMLAKDLVTEMTTQLSTATVRTLDRSIGGASLTWDKKAPDGVSFMEHILSFPAKLASAENQILGQAGRIGDQLVYIVGSESAAVFRILTGFKPAEGVRATLGTHLYGFYEGKPVIRSLAIAPDEVIVSSRGNDNYENSVIYAPYMPLFVTDSFQGMDHNPLNSQKAAAAMIGIKPVLPGLSTKIKILNAGL